MAQYVGVVRWFNHAKGYGFLRREAGADVFVNYNSILSDGDRTLREGDEVTFDIVHGDKGPQADQVSCKRALNTNVAPDSPLS